MIEYLYQEGVRSEDMKQIKVSLDGLVCGTIKPTNGGWHYIPKGQPKSMAGKTFKTIKEVQRSLKGCPQKPTPVPNPDFSQLLKDCEDYLNHIEDPINNHFKDAEHYIFETAIKAIYGKENKPFDWVNSKT